MADKLALQESKEFQLKVLWSGTEGVPGVTDREIFMRVTQVIAECVLRLARGGETTLAFNEASWLREGIRFDTPGKVFKQQNLTLAIEATDQLTKLKCKQHQFVPELLFDKPKHSVCFPHLATAAQYKKHATKFKLEQDLHFSNLKYCASGSLFLKGRQTNVKKVGFFADYFPALAQIASPQTKLEEVSHWDEFVFDDMRTAWGGVDLTSWMLVNRWQHNSSKLLESELSFKVEKIMQGDWDYKLLKQASALYLALQQSGIFQAVPPIFFYGDPVSSRPIMLVEA